MRRINRSGRRGRPRGRTPLFVEDCCRLDATTLLAKARGGSPQDGLEAWPVTLTWTQYAPPQVQTLVLPVTSTPQPLGGVRRWWQCQSCGRRCRILLIAEDGPPACRRCWGAVYSADYPGRHFWRQFGNLFRGMANGMFSVNPEGDHEVDLLLAKRRRGVRRGRRVLVRAARHLGRFGRGPEVATALLAEFNRRQ